MILPCPRGPAGIQLAEFCDDRLDYDHGGGHDTPRSAEVSDKIGGMIKQLMSQVQILTDEAKEDGIPD